MRNSFQLFSNAMWRLHDDFRITPNPWSESASSRETEDLLTLHKKWSFPSRIFSVNVTKSAVSCGFNHLLTKSLMENFIFCAVPCLLKKSSTENFTFAWCYDMIESVVKTHLQTFFFQFLIKIFLTLLL